MLYWLPKFKLIFTYIHTLVGWKNCIGTNKHAKHTDGSYIKGLGKKIAVRHGRAARFRDFDRLVKSPSTLKKWDRRNLSFTENSDTLSVSLCRIKNSRHDADPPSPEETGSVHGRITFRRNRNGPKTPTSSWLPTKLVSSLKMSNENGNRYNTRGVTEIIAQLVVVRHVMRKKFNKNCLRKRKKKIFCNNIFEIKTFVYTFNGRQTWNLR